MYDLRHKVVISNRVLDTVIESFYDKESAVTKANKLNRESEEGVFYVKAETGMIVCPECGAVTNGECLTCLKKKSLLYGKSQRGWHR